MNKNRPILDSILTPQPSPLVRFVAMGGDILFHRNLSKIYLAQATVVSVVLFFVFRSMDSGTAPFSNFSLPFPTGSSPFKFLGIIYLVAIVIQIFLSLLASKEEGSIRDEKGEPWLQQWLPFEETVTKRIIEPVVLVLAGAGLCLLWYPTVSLGVGVWLISMGGAMFVRGTFQSWGPRRAYSRESTSIVTSPDGPATPIQDINSSPKDRLPPEFRELLDPD